MLNKEDLAKISLFYGISDAEREEIALITDRKEYPKNTSIICEDGSGGEFYIIHKGKVAINRVISARGYQTLAVLKKGDYFGSLSLVDGKKHCASAVSLTDSVTYNITKKNFDKLVIRNPKLGIKIITNISVNNCLLLRKMNAKVFDLFKYVLISTTL